MDEDAVEQENPLTPEQIKAGEIVRDLAKVSGGHEKDMNDPRIRQEEAANKVSALGMYASFLKKTGYDRRAVEAIVTSLPDQKKYMKDILTGLNAMTEHLDLFEDKDKSKT